MEEVRNQTISCSRPIRAAHREEPATPPPPPEGKEIPLAREKRNVTLCMGRCDYHGEVWLLSYHDILPP